MHKDATRESNESRGVRLPVRLWRLIEAAQAKRGDPFVGTTIRRACEEYVARELDMREAA